MHRPQPFARAMLMFEAIAVLLRTHNHIAGAPMSTTLTSAMADLGNYESRGKGEGTFHSARIAAANRRKHQKHMATAARYRRKMKAKHSRRARA